MHNSIFIFFLLLLAIVLFISCKLISHSNIDPHIISINITLIHTNWVFCWLLMIPVSRASSILFSLYTHFFSIYYLLNNFKPIPKWLFELRIGILDIIYYFFIWNLIDSKFICTFKEKTFHIFDNFLLNQIKCRN